MSQMIDVVKMYVPAAGSSQHGIQSKLRSDQPEGSVRTAFSIPLSSVPLQYLEPQARRPSSKL
jgi:hypothetical protein